MEMVSAARLRRAEQRIAELRPYAQGIRMMTRRAVDAAEHVPNMPLLEDRQNVRRVGIIAVTADRGLAGAFNSQIIRAANRRAQELRGDAEVLMYAIGRRGVSSLRFRGFDVEGEYTGFTDRPGFANARVVAQDVVAAYGDEKLDRVEIIFNHYESPIVQTVESNVLLPIHQIEDVVEGDEDENGDEAQGQSALWLYEPDPEEILRRLVTDYVEISIYRAMLESTASEHGARMTAMRNASENASELIEDYTLEMNRQRQAEITQEIMEVVAGAEGLR